MKTLFLLLFSFFTGTIAAQQPLTAEVVMQQALQQAGKENKNVFLIFHASWCGWCHKMDSSMADSRVRVFFDANYVVRHLTVLESAKNKALENPGGHAMLLQYKGEEQGIPFWLVFDASGKLLADALIRPAGTGLDAPGQNVGCPATEAEVEHFITVLQKTSRIKVPDLQIIRKVFRENDH